MINKPNKNKIRQQRHKRVRAKVSGTAEVPRLCVYRSTTHIYVQVIDDVAGHTLLACSSKDKMLAPALKGLTKLQAALEVGKETAKRALSKNINSVVFDRGGYLYTGRVKNIADGARQAGLKL